LGLYEFRGLYCQESIIALTETKIKQAKKKLISPIWKRIFPVICRQLKP